MVGASFRREREKRYAGLGVEEKTGIGGRELRDLDELVGRGVRQHGAVGEQILRAVGEAHEEEARDPPYTGLRPEDADCRSQHVSRMFFKDVGSLPLDPLLKVVESEEDALDTLIGARSRGASIPELEDCLEEADQRLPRERTSRLWLQYASLGQFEARYAIEHHRDRILEIAPSVLEQDPEHVIPLLLSRVRKTDKCPSGVPVSADSLDIVEDTEASNDALVEFRRIDPLDALTRWVKTAAPERTDALHRRSTLIHVADHWYRNGGNACIALRAMCIALDPRCEHSTADPGAGRTITLHFGNLSLKHIESIAGLWPTIRDAVHEAENVPWKDLLQVASVWLRRDPLHVVPEDVLNRMQSVAHDMLRDLARASRGHPGVLHQVLSIGQNAELIAGMTLDLDFKTLYPTEQPDPAKELEMMTGAGLPEDFLDRWARRSTEEIAASLARIESEAALVGINDPRWSPGLCARLVKRVPDSVAIADACLRHKLPADLVGPFVISAATTKQPGWQGLVQCCLDLRSYGGLAAQVVLTQDRPPQELLTRALVAAGDFPRVINACCLRGEVPVTTLHQMFRADDPQVAVAAAIGRWCSVRQRADRDNLLDDAWRQAILRASDDGSGLSHHDQYWIREILAQDPRLAEGWLLLRFSRCSQGAVSWELEEIATGLVPRLDVRQRARVLAGLRADCGSDKLVKCLVGDDNDLYQRLLDTKELTPLHVLLYHLVRYAS